jgi:amino acid adenylation domain-containing protein
MFEEQATRTPDVMAVVFEDAFLSYAELNRRANQLAHYLRYLGVKPDTRVAIYLERGLEMIVALLAVLKAGGAYVPLDPAWPVERLRFMLGDSVPVALVTYGHLETLLSGISDSVPVLDLKAGTAAWQEQPATNPDTAAVGLTLSHLAYVIYTSGSTGTPKGIMVQHSALANFLCSMQHNPGIKPADVLVAVTTFAFDIAALEFYLPLTMGARLVILSRDATVDGARLLRELQGGVSMMQATPASWRMLLDAGWKGTTGLKVLCGGEALDDGLAQSLIARGSSVWNMYGPTETTIWSLMKGLSGVEDKVSIGRPIANTRVYILDNHGQLVPVGVAGELYIGGAGVVRGYLNRPELTAERFLKDPFAADADARMYRTGDLCRWLADGNIEFLGRNDFQVKIRGFRIELGEIEARLAKYPGVREAVVAAREDDPGDKRLVAYYTTVTSGEEQTGEKQQEVVDRERLRSHLSATLPEYMVPAAYVHVNAFPLLPNGKLDRKALPVPAGDAYAVQGYEAPQGEIENQLAAIWAELLKLDRVGRHDNFFSLGGHSLLAVTLIERMRRHSFSVDVRTLFVTPTLAQLAATISTKARSVNIPDNLIPAACQAITPEMLPLVELTREEIAGIVSMVGGGAGNIQDIYPLVPLQEGILFHYQMGGGEGDPYLLASQMSFDSRSRLDRYLGAMQRVVERHDILRTAVLWEGLAEPVQVVWRQAVLPVEEVELDAAAGDVAQQLYARFDPRHFRIDVRQAPLLRFYVAHDASADRWLLMMLLHHLVGDHTSLERMMGEVQRYLLGQEASLPAPLPFRQLVAQARLGVSREEHEVFFRQMLGDVEEATAPFGLREVHGDGRGIEQGRLVVNEDLARRLRVQARKLGVSVASLCHLAWGRVLGKVSGREDVVFGTVLFGRMQGWEGVDRVMGLFINTLPVRLRVGDEGVETAVRSTQVLLAGLMCHEHASLAVAQRCSAVPAPVPLFSALLNYRNLAGAAQALPSPARQAWEGIRFLRSEERTNYPLTFSVNDLGGGLTLEAQVAGSVGPLRICAYMNTALESLVEALETSPARAVSSLEVLPEPERHQLLYEWNDTGREFPIGKCVHELFEEQVERTPEAVAVVHEDQQLSYGELNRRSNQLAHYLRQLGVKPDMRVAICLDRGLEMTVALLGVLKAGGAYVPLDPGYPAERLRFMLQDSAPAVLLTQGHLERLFLELKGALQVIDLGTEAGQWTDESNTNPDRARAGLASRHLAYIIYTSGSTGTPKGVSIEHRSAVNFIQWAQVSFSGDSLEHTLFSTSLNFDLAVYEWLVPITAGCTVRIVPSVLELAQTKLDVTLINTVPSAMKSLMEMDGVPQTVRTVNLAGEPLKRALVERIFATTEVSTVCNLYGPSETTTYSTWVCMGRGDGFAAHIGRPIANTRVYILDAQLEPVPVGVAGELYIGGAGVARGYQRRAEQTAERFVPEPYGEEAGGRMYRTGDVGRWLEDGTIEFLGRNDDQVKIRGFRVELGEIEARLMEHSGVREAVVIMGEATAGDKRLVAYYTAVEEETRLSAEVLRPYLSARLPEYMIPAAYVRMEKLPLTPNGKLDRRALASVEELAQRGGERKYEGPRTAVEEILCGIWEEVLNVERVGVCHNFFELGGHSLLATRVVSRVRETLFVTVSVRNLFEAPTIREFSQRVLEREVQQGQTEKIAIIFKQVQLLDAQ